MRHLSLVPPLPREPRDDVDPLAFFQMASGICLCTDCSKARHPAYSGRVAE